MLAFRVAFALSVALAAQPAPTQEATPQVLPVLRLSAAMTRALDSMVPGFRTWDSLSYEADIRRLYRHSRRQRPWAVLGDFNGDRRIDIMLDGYTLSRELTLALVSRGAQYQVVVVDSSSRSSRGLRNTFLEYAPPGRYGFEDLGGIMTLRHDGVSLVYFEAASELLYWVRDHFERWTTGD